MSRASRDVRPQPRVHAGISASDPSSLENVPAQSKRWRTRYRYGGKEKMRSLGRYPEVWLKMARDRRDLERRRLSKGVAPQRASPMGFFVDASCGVG